MNFETFSAKFKKLTGIKPHLDFLTALLTIPVLLTVIILNFTTLTKNAKNSPLTPIPTISTTTQALTAVPVKTTPVPNQNTTSCTPGIGPISITSPSQGETVTTNPVCIDISYAGKGYCSIVWAYRINGGPLSDYSNNSVCLYNMPNGPVSFELDVKSLASSDTTILKRNFTYEGTTLTPTTTISPTPTPSVSPTVTPTPTQ